MSNALVSGKKTVFAREGSGVRAGNTLSSRLSQSLHPGNFPRELAVL